MNYLLLIVGLIGSIYFYSEISRAGEANSWERTDAVLDYFETPSYFKNAQGYEKECKRIEASYSYTYANKKYSSNTVSILPPVQMWAHQVDALVEKYKWQQGGQIQVYVNPENPSKATMLKGSTETSIDVWIFFSFSLLLFLGGLTHIIKSFIKMLVPPALESADE